MKLPDDIQPTVVLGKAALREELVDLGVECDELPAAVAAILENACREAYTRGCDAGKREVFAQDTIRPKPSSATQREFRLPQRPVTVAYDDLEKTPVRQLPRGVVDRLRKKGQT